MFMFIHIYIYPFSLFGEQSFKGIVCKWNIKLCTWFYCPINFIFSDQIRIKCRFKHVGIDFLLFKMDFLNRINCVFLAIIKSTFKPNKRSRIETVKLSTTHLKQCKVHD